MTLSDITKRINFLTDTTTSEYSAADRLISQNKWYNLVHTWILESHDEIDFDDSNKTDFPILTSDLVAGQQDYSLPSGTITIKRLEAKLDGSTWRKCTPFDIEERATASDTTAIAGSFNTGSPRYDVQYNSIFFYPIPQTNVTGGYKIWINRSVTEFTSSDVTTGTLVPGFDVNFHDILPLGVAFDWAVAKGRPNKVDLWTQLQALEAGLKRHYGKKQEDRVWEMKSNYQNME